MLKILYMKEKKIFFLNKAKKSDYKARKQFLPNLTDYLRGTAESLVFHNASLGVRI